MDTANIGYPHYPVSNRFTGFTPSLYRGLEDNSGRPENIVECGWEAADHHDARRIAAAAARLTRRGIAPDVALDASFELFYS